EPVVVELPVSEVKRILGFEIPQSEIEDILRRLQFTVAASSDILTVTMLDHRMDIGTGVIGQADLIEEIARIYGYNRIPDTQISDAIPPQHGNVKLEREEMVRDILAGVGLREVINYRLTTPELEARVTPTGAKSSWGSHQYITLANPISNDKTVMRHTLMAGLLDIAERNEHFQRRQALFEIGNVYYPDPGQLLPQEPARLGMVMTGLRQLPDWQHGLDQIENMDFFDLKGVVVRLLAGLRIEPEAIRYEAAEHNSFYPGRTARLMIHGETIGTLGELHPLVRENYNPGSDLQKPILAAEFDLDALLAFARPGHPVKPIPTQPAVYQDISLLVNRSLSAAEVERVIWKAGGSLLVGVELFDVYTGEQVPANQKSLAYSLTYQHPEETLTDKRVAQVHQKIVAAVETQLDAKLRA
ncbi:MAG TPA: phenylalanine--tRNA ligase subunit beta, partial [Aggregatilineales bacterium]|nr:phenylalanine--tRNA ligase subunit beta [Aggregatilineales bacterium]